MFLRPGLIRLIPAAIVGIGWVVNAALAYIRGTKILKKEKDHAKIRDNTT